ncbi:hypothetical protein CPT_Moonbeam168 [Bacillus phage Moonbeam]|uniref:Uncharacterized protein n=1 Tax=Bacillus phage Moonbeam TaxID=1540091 RepID=A0A0A0RSQ4_9CAUD|nr:hypothetical protein CPT_Moonbeam168 [Bacillus phage Moonbeam]AIW03566.1 hypothetical protein CPT_Moonbeam168 [Bacillus phage Moonbeam]
MEPTTEFNMLKMTIILDKLTDTFDDVMALMSEQAKCIASLEKRIAKLEEDK